VTGDYTDAGPEIDVSIVTREAAFGSVYDRATLFDTGLAPDVFLVGDDLLTADEYRELIDQDFPCNGGDVD
jgi:hypothetical protein